MKTALRKRPIKTPSDGNREGAALKMKLDKEQAIQAALQQLDEIKPRNTKTKKLISLLKTWLTDESGYDEEALPELKKALDIERKRIGARRLFDG